MDFHFRYNLFHCHNKYKDVKEKEVRSECATAILVASLYYAVTETVKDR